MNKILSEFGAFFVILSIVIFAVVVYIMKYSDLDSFDRINRFTIILGSLVILNIALYFSKALERARKRKIMGTIIYILKPEANFFFVPTLISIILSGGVLILWLYLYITIRPSFVGLAMIILFSILTYDSLAVYLTEIGIAEKGIVDGHYYYMWDEILSHSYDEIDNKLILNVKKKYIFFKMKGKSKLRYNKEEKSKIDQILILNNK